MRGLKVMSSNDKIKNKAIENSCILLGTCFLFAALLLMFWYYFFEYRFSEILIYYLSTYVCSAIILLYLAFVSVKQLKFYYIFVFLIFLLFLVTFFQCLINGNLKNIFGIIFDTSVWASATILIINNLITRVFFREGDNKNSQDVDAVSSEFAVDVISVSLFFGIIFGTIAYLFFVPSKDIALFFAGIDIKNVAIATAGLVTFFWAAKTAKNKSIELEEKKQDGKRRDKEIKMAESRDTAQLIAKASELLGSENDAQKYAGLSFLNTVASQKGGPLQKEAFDLLADFILSASNTTTSNKPRMRAITYINNQIENNCHEFRIYTFIEISFSNILGILSDLNNINALIFQNLMIVYIGFNVYFRFIDEVNELKAERKIALSDCTIYGARMNGNIVDLTGIKLLNSTVYCCKIKEIPPVVPVKFYDEKTAEEKIKENINKFKFCNFSDCMNWEYAHSFVKANKNDIFDGCFYYAGHAPDGFDKKYEGALLTEITSEQQFNETLGVQCGLKYSPPDDDKKTSNE